MKKILLLICVFILAICSFSMFACELTDSPSSTVVNSDSKIEDNKNEEKNNEEQDENKEPKNDEQEKDEEPSNDNEIKYDIEFYDENGALVTTQQVKENAVPSYNYTKADTVEWDYTVQGWATTQDGDVLSSLAPATENTSYYAIVSSVKKQYTISFNSNGGSAVASITRDYNTSVSAPSEPEKDGYVFVAWCTDATLNTTVSWPVNITGNTTYYASWNEKVDMKGYLSSLKSAMTQDPYSYIPNSMRPTNTDNYVSEQDVTYDFTTFNNVSNIKYGGYGEQWHMVVENISQSEKFYTVFTLADTAITASVVAFNNWFDNNPSSTNKDIDETGYYASVEFSKGTLLYTIQLKTNYSVPLFGQVQPIIEMEYDVFTGEKSVKVSLTETNVMRYIITEDTYKFAMEYGINNVNRTAYFEITTSGDNIEGHIYEYITALGKDAVKSCADFYITEDYTSVVGNKASGIVLLDGYINELYNTATGKLLGYKVQESKTILGVTATYNTLWFNLNNINGINSVKAIEKDETVIKPNENNHNIYINGSSSVFEPTYNTIGIGSLKKNTSRKYDIEMRKQYFYNEVDGKLVCYEVEVPMMFIQDGDNYNSFSSDISNKSGINATVTLSNAILTQIREDYEEIIPIFIENKEEWSSATIIAWIEE